MHTILITESALDPLEAMHTFQQTELAGITNCGATVTFTGTMRDINEDDEVVGMLLEHYPGMAEAMLLKVLEQAQAQWDVKHCLLIHRVGQLSPGEILYWLPSGHLTVLMRLMRPGF